MNRRAMAILAAEFAILALLAGSAVALDRNSRNFLLAERQAVLQQLQPDLPIVLSGEGSQTATLLSGWDRSEPWGALAAGRTVVLALKLPPNRPSVLTFVGRFPAASRSARQIEVSLNGRAIAAMSIAGPPGAARCRWSIALPAPTAALSLLRFTDMPAVFWVALPDAPNHNQPMLGLESMSLTAVASMPQCADGALLTVTGERTDGLPS